MLPKGEGSTEEVILTFCQIILSCRWCNQWPSTDEKEDDLDLDFEIN